MIAFPCGQKYSTPIGLLGGPPWFIRVYKGARLESHFNGCLILLAPSNPVHFYESLMHRLEKEIDYEGPFPQLREDYGSWFICSPQLAGSSPEYLLYECDKIRPIILTPFTGYIRGYGCLVELLIIYTRVRNRIWSIEKETLEYLNECVRRSVRDGSLNNISRRITENISKYL